MALHTLLAEVLVLRWGSPSVRRRPATPRELAGTPGRTRDAAGHLSALTHTTPRKHMSLLELPERAAAQAVQAFRDPSGLLAMGDLWWVALALAGLATYWVIHSLIYPWRRCLRCKGSGKKHAGIWPRREAPRLGVPEY